MNCDWSLALHDLASIRYRCRYRPRSSFVMDLFGRPLARPRNVHVHSEAVHVHVHVHDDAASTSTSTSTSGCRSVRSWSKSKSGSGSIPARYSTRPSCPPQTSLPSRGSTPTIPGASSPNPSTRAFDTDSDTDPDTDSLPICGHLRPSADPISEWRFPSIQAHPCG